jgi:hypothetical protein
VAPPNPTTDACPSTPPLVSNLNPGAGEALPNRVIAPLGPHEDVCIFNAVGSIDIIIDVNGWFGNGLEAAPGALFYSVPPTRTCDTRIGSMTECAGKMLTNNSVEDIEVAGVDEVPNLGGTSPPVALVANLTGVAGDEPTYFTVYPSDVAQPRASDLNPSAGSVIANLSIVGIAQSGPLAGEASLYNAQGTINAILDIAGWFQ